MTDDNAAGLPPLAGIDTRAGMAIAHGEVILYRRVLRRFGDQQRNFAARFRAARQNPGDTNAATRVAHTLNGLAGNLGIAGVQRAAKRLEQCCERGQEFRLDSELRALLDERRVVLDGLTALDEPPPSDNDGPDHADADPSRIPKLMDRLRASIVDSSAEAGNLVQQLAPLLQPTPETTVLNALRRTLDAYDFDRALELQQQLAGELGLPR